MQVLSEKLSKEGYLSVYNGISAFSILAIKPAIQFTFFEQLRNMLLRYASTPGEYIPLPPSLALY